MKARTHTQSLKLILTSFVFISGCGPQTCGPQNMVSVLMAAHFDWDFTLYTGHLDHHDHHYL